MKTEIHDAVILTTQHYDAPFIAKAIRDYNLWTQDHRIASYKFNRLSRETLEGLNSNSTVLIFSDDPCAEDINDLLFLSNLGNCEIIYL